MTGLAACFYTDPVNRKPIARFERTDHAPLGRNSTFTVDSAASDDPDGRETIRSFFWEARFCTNLDVPWADCQANGESAATTFSPRFPKKGVIRVRLTVTDEHGASDTSEDAIVADNGVPQIVLVEQSGEFDASRPLDCAEVPFDKPARFRIEWLDPDCCDPGECCDLGTFGDACPGDTDLTCDNLEITWDLVKPSASRLVEDVGYGPRIPRVPPTDPEDETGRTFYVDPDVGGDRPVGLPWLLTATISDGLTSTTSEPIAFCTFADNPPCIELTDPPREAELVVVKLDGAPRTFRVQTVEDAADPYPDPGIDSQLTFQWFVGPEGSVPAAVPGATGPSFVFDHSDYDQLERAVVRVEVHDRLEREACPAAEPTCSASSDTSCVQRHSWTVEVR